MCSSGPSLGRIGIFVPTIHMVNLKRNYKELFEEIDGNIRDKYVSEKSLQCFSMVKPSESSKTLASVSSDLFDLVGQFKGYPEIKNMHSFKLLERVLNEQCNVSDDGKQVEVKKPKEIPSDSLQNPSDPDATYSGHKGQGYQVQVMETYCKDGGSDKCLNLITHIEVEPSHESDASALIPAIESVNEEYPVAEITKEMCRKFLKHQNDTRSGYASNKDHKNLSAAWTWGIENMDNWGLEINSFRSVKKFKEIRKPRYVSPEEDFWKVYEEQTDQRDKAMLLTFLHLAARRGELFRLKRNDLDFQNRRARLWTQKREEGMEYDWLPITVELSECLSSWWKKRMELGLTDSQHVFVCLDENEVNAERYGEPFSARCHFMRRICKRAKVEAFGFHGIRHLAASILFRQGYSVGQIQQFLRHKSPSTTEKYLKSLGLELVREALEESFSREHNVFSVEEAREKKAQKEMTPI